MNEKQDINSALLEVQKELYDSATQLSKDSEVKYGATKYSYCSLPELLRVIVPILHKHGIYIDHSFDIVNNKETLLMLLIHAQTGQKALSRVYHSSEDTDEKAWGGGTTYKRRYMIMSKLGIFPDDDNSELVRTISAAQLEDVYASLEVFGIQKARILAQYKIKKLSEMTASDYKSFATMIYRLRSGK